MQVLQRTHGPLWWPFVNTCMGMLDYIGRNSSSELEIFTWNIVGWGFLPISNTYPSLKSLRTIISSYFVLGPTMNPNQDFKWSSFSRLQDDRGGCCSRYIDRSHTGCFCVVQVSTIFLILCIFLTGFCIYMQSIVLYSVTWLSAHAKII